MTNSQSPTTVGWPPPVIEKAHFTFSFGMSAAARPGRRWKRVDWSSRPVEAQSPGVGVIGGLTAHIGSVPIGPVRTAIWGISAPVGRAGAAEAAGVAAAGLM